MKKSANPHHGNGTKYRALVLDVETTGLNPARDEIIELAIVSFRFDAAGHIFRASVEEYSDLREPSRSIAAAATRVHGLTDAEVAGRRLNEQRIYSLVSQADFYIAHNASFDRSFLEVLFPALFRPGRWLCTMRDVDWWRRGLSSRGLASIARHYRITHDDAHRALGDARTTFALLSLPSDDDRPLLFGLLQRQGVDMPEAPTHLQSV